MERGLGLRPPASHRMRAVKDRSEYFRLRYERNKENILAKVAEYRSRNREAIKMARTGGIPVPEARRHLTAIKRKEAKHAQAHTSR